MFVATWIGHKSAQHNYSHCLGCVLAHYQVSRLFFCSIWYPVILVIFDPKNTHFQTHLDLELHLDGAEKCPTHLSPLLGVCFGPLSSFQVDFCSIWHPVILAVFTPKTTHFWTHLDLE